MQMYTQRCTAQPNEEVLNYKEYFSLFLRPTKIKKIEQSGKNPQNYAVERNESFSFEQKPIEINIFNNDEEAEI